MRIKRQINGIYNTVQRDNEVFFVPRFYPQIMRIRLDDFACEECYEINYEIGNAGVILIEDKEFFFCITRNPISIIRISKRDGNNELYKYEGKMSLCNEALIYGDNIIILSSEVNTDGGIILGKNRNHNLKFIDMDIEDIHLQETNISCDGLSFIKSIKKNILSSRYKRMFKCKEKYLLVSGDSVDVMIDSQIQNVYRFSENEQKINGSLYLNATTYNNKTFLWPWKNKYVLSINWDTLETNKKDIMFDCKWSNNIAIEGKEFILRDFLSGLIDGRG